MLHNKAVRIVNYKVKKDRSKYFALFSSVYIYSNNVEGRIAFRK